jgi:hypothetical protein
LKPFVAAECYIEAKAPTPVPIHYGGKAKAKAGPSAACPSRSNRVKEKDRATPVGMTMDLRWRQDAGIEEGSFAALQDDGLSFGLKSGHYTKRVHSLEPGGGNNVGLAGIQLEDAPAAQAACESFANRMAPSPGRML